MSDQTINQTNIMKPIKYVDYGIANSFEDCIEINRKLCEFPELMEQIIQHERNHTDKKFSFTDLIEDLSILKLVNQSNLIKFIIYNPSSLSQFLPLYKHKERGFVYDINLTLMYIMGFALIGLSVGGWWLI